MYGLSIGLVAHPLIYQGIINPIVDRLLQAISVARSDPKTSQPLLMQALDSLTACFKGLSPADDEIFDLSEDEASLKARTEGTQAAKVDPRIQLLRSRIEQAVSGIIAVWSGDGDVADVSHQHRESSRQARLISSQYHLWSSIRHYLPKLLSRSPLSHSSR